MWVCIWHSKVQERESFDVSVLLYFYSEQLPGNNASSNLEVTYLCMDVS